MKVQRVKSSGAGGQNVNKRNTAVRVSVSIDEVAKTPQEKEKLKKIADSNGNISVFCQRNRTQKQNLRDAKRILFAKIRNALKEKKKRKKTNRPKEANERRLREKKMRKLKKERRRQKWIDLH